MDEPYADWKHYHMRESIARLRKRNLAIFEFKNGLTDGIKHTFKETGKKFGISLERVRQIDAKVWDVLKNTAP